MMITMKHIRQSKMCSKGTRKFFCRHGLDWQSFIRNGIDESELLKTNDAMALKVVEVANGW